jgi:hypothetical protein
MNSRTGLNVRTGYADPDHRAETHEKRESKRGSLPELQVKKFRMGYMATSFTRV